MSKIYKNREILIALAEGKKLRGTRWKETDYVYMDNEGIIRTHLGNDYKGLPTHLLYCVEWESPKVLCDACKKVINDAC